MEKTSDEDIWLMNQGQAIQDFEIPEVELIDDTPPSFIEINKDDDDSRNEYVSDREVKTQLNLQKLQQPTAELFVGILDVIVPILLLYLFKNIDKNDAKLEDDEKEQLTNALSIYLATKEVSVSPMMGLLFTLVTIYGAKILYIKTLKKQEVITDERRKEES